MNDLRVNFPKPCSEDWNEMRPTGCNRHCAQCDKIIHDLEQMTLDEAEALIASDGEACVRARLNSQGVVQLRPGARASSRKMIAASVGLLALAGQAAAADSKSTTSIIGTLQGAEDRTSVIATGTDGKTYKAKVKTGGRYEIKHVPPGTYQLRFAVRCFPGDRGGWDGPIVVVGEGPASVEHGDEHEFFCPIIVGQIQLQSDQG